MECGRPPSYSVLDNAQLCKLFVGGLNPNTDESDLRGYFEAFGSLLSCVVVMNPNTSRSRCFGFITFSSVNEADRAMAASPHAVDGSRVELKRAVPREDSGKPGAHARVKKIFVGGIKGDVGESDLVRHFSQFGLVEKAEIIIDKQSGRKRGFAFVHFVDHDTADKAAVVKFQPIQGHRVEVKKALPREDLDPWGLDLPDLGSSRTWRPSNRARTGLSSSPSSDPNPKPNVDPSPNPSPTPILNPAGWSDPKLAGWLGPELAGWAGPKPPGWPDPKPPGWLGPKPPGLPGSKPPGWPCPEPPENPDAKSAGGSSLEADGDHPSTSVGGPDSKSSGGPDLKPDGDFDPKFDRSLISTVAWNPYPKPAWILSPRPAWIPSAKSGWGPNQKPGWEPDPKAVGVPIPKSTEETWVPEGKPGTGPASNPVLTPKFEPSLSRGLGPKISPFLNLGSGRKPDLGPNLKPGLLGPVPRPKLGLLGPNLKPGLLGPGPCPKPGLLGPCPMPNPGFVLGSGPLRNVSRGTRDQNAGGGNCNRSGVYRGRSENQTSYSQCRAALGPMKRRWDHLENRGGPSRGTHRDGASGFGDN